jgi:hypothetical protein
MRIDRADGGFHPPYGCYNILQRRGVGILGTTPEFWMNLQKGFELAEARAGLDEGELAGMRVA